MATATDSRKCSNCYRKAVIAEGGSECVYCTNKRKIGHTVKKGHRSAFAYRGGASYVSLAQLQDDIRFLAGELPADITAIAGVARSGLKAACTIAELLHLPLLAIRQTKGDIIEAGNGWRLGGKSHVDISGGKVAVIDDTVMTGNSLRAIAGICQSRFDSHVTAAVYVNPSARRKPDIWARDLEWPHILEWNVFNSVLSPNIAVDFDGILCRDCHPKDDDDGERYLEFIQNAKPLYLPRKRPLAMIVTARIEKYREATLDWLKRHRVKCHNLVMHPAKTLAERRKDDIAAFKAKHYSDWLEGFRPRPEPALFFESDDQQAKRIAEISKRIVVCPASGKCYGA